MLRPTTITPIPDHRDDEIEGLRELCKSQMAAIITMEQDIKLLRYVIKQSFEGDPRLLEDVYKSMKRNEDPDGRH